MKKLIICLLMFIPLQMVSGQDRIITIQNDTIHCRILSISPAHIHYEQKAENEYVVGRFISAEQVLTYLRGQTDSQKPKLVNKHYLGFSLTNGVSRNIGSVFESSTWEYNNFGVSFEYANRKGSGEVGTGLNISKMYVAVPITAKKYLGKYIYIGIGVMPGYSSTEGLCVGASVMAGVEYVSEDGFSISLSPSLRHSAMNLVGKEKNSNTYSGIHQHALVSIGLGYRF